MSDMVFIATVAIAATQFRDEKLRALASNPALLATEAADYLVHKGVPFRQAHDLVGKVLREAERQGKPWTKLSLEDVQKISPLFEKDFFGRSVGRGRDRQQDCSRRHRARMRACRYCDFAEPSGQTHHQNRSQAMNASQATKHQSSVAAVAEDRRSLPGPPR